ncbi:MAG TPA: ABC transporter permease [Anaerolineales bacterium]|nr:ABC transporter permease [Anaerolineales bacterium]
MTNFQSALWAETLKARRSKVPWLAAIGFTLAPLMDGFFMFIMKDPERAREMGLLSVKAQMAMSTAEWGTFFSVLSQAIAIGGAIVFSIVTAWIFGREFSDHTAKDLMALPTSRENIVTAKLLVMTAWVFAVSLWIYLAGLLIGSLVDIPGWTTGLAWQSFIDLIATAGMTLLLMTPVAFIASMGRGYLPPLGWAVLTIFFSQIIAATGWGDWFPWAVPALFSGAAGPRGELIGVHSYVLVIVAGITGLAATFYWWRSADQTR